MKKAIIALSILMFSVSAVAQEAARVSTVISISKENISKARTAWDWIIPQNMEPLQITCFGDWVLGHPDGSIWFLDSLEGSLEKLADNSAQFNLLKQDPKFRDRYYLEGKVIALYKEGKVIKVEESYAYTIHPILGGSFDSDNIKVMDATINMTMLGQLHHQLKKPNEFKRKYGLN